MMKTTDFLDNISGRTAAKITADEDNNLSTIIETEAAKPLNFAFLAPLSKIILHNYGDRVEMHLPNPIDGTVQCSFSNSGWKAMLDFLGISSKVSDSKATKVIF